MAQLRSVLACVQVLLVGGMASYLVRDDYCSTPLEVGTEMMSSAAY